MKSILIVEDDTDIGNVLQQVIAQETSFEAIHVTNGIEALKIVARHKPSLFLLDYRLPSMTGIELFDLLHNIPGLEQTPAILISANYPKVEIEQRHLLYLKKPFDLHEVLTTIEQLLA